MQRRPITVVAAARIITVIALLLVVTSHFGTTEATAVESKARKTKAPTHESDTVVPCRQRWGGRHCAKCTRVWGCVRVTDPSRFTILQGRAVPKPGYELTKGPKGVRKCQSGHFKRWKGNYPCSRCLRNNTVQPRTGQTSCITCPAGQRANWNHTQCIATSRPTQKPTIKPTIKPTKKPTNKPASPTSAPTTAPTAQPTATPTVAPTAAPTAEPTAEPTAAPTAEPTPAPVAEPIVGQLVIAGGEYKGSYTKTAELVTSEEQGAPPTAVFTHSMTAARAHHESATTMSGLTLVVGGWNDTSTTLTPEVWGVCDGTWSQTQGMSCPDRTLFRVLPLNNGRTLVMGGRQSNPPKDLRSCELLESDGTTWTDAPWMPTARSAFDAVKLNEGTVTVTGGSSDGSTLAGTNVYSPFYNAWFVWPDMHAARQQHAMAVMTGDAGLLVSGGSADGDNSTLDSTEAMFDIFPRTAPWFPDEDGVQAQVPVGSSPWWVNLAPMTTPRKWHRLFPLAPGQLGTGGSGGAIAIGGNNGATSLTSSEIYDIKTDTWTLLPSELAVARPYWARFEVIPGGDIIVSGSCGGSYNLNTGDCPAGDTDIVERLSLTTGQWSTVTHTKITLAFHTMVYNPSTCDR